MKKQLLFLSFFLTVSFYLSAQQAWNFSEWEAQDFASTVTIDGLTIAATEEAKVSIDANKKSIDEYSFTQRLKLGGAGNPEEGTFLPTNRYVSFEVTGKCAITVYGMSSSSGAERTLVISNGEESLETFVNDGTAIGKQVIEYDGPATTIYMYSQASGFNIYGIFVEEEVTPNPGSDYSWNFSDWDMQDFASTVTIEDLTIAATEEAKVSIDANKKSIDDYDFTQRLKLGGGGNPEEGTFLPTNRYVSFEIAGNSTITVYGMSSSSGAERTLVISNGEESLETLVNDGTAIGKQVIQYEGPATTIYMYSQASGFNIYAIFVKAEGSGSGIQIIDNTGKIVKSVLYYDVTGRPANQVSQGILIEKTTFEDGTSVSKKILKKQ